MERRRLALAAAVAVQKRRQGSRLPTPASSRAIRAAALLAQLGGPGEPRVGAPNLYEVTGGETGGDNWLQGARARTGAVGVVVDCVTQAFVAERQPVAASSSTARCRS